MAVTPGLNLMDQVKQGVEILRKGGLVVYPTDTVYGLGASAFMEKAVERVYEAKGRPRPMALPVLVAEKEDLEKLAAGVPDLAWRLAERFLPGPLTLVLRRSSLLPSIVSGGGDTVALRIPNHPVPIALIRGLGAPIIGTSANLTGMPSPLIADEACRQMGGRVDFIIDGGRCPGGLESTVVDVTGPVPRIVREGAISRKSIEEVCDSALA
ncbi:MAG: threonylcarbamoyl-AMP synthase [Chloroflexi bacterium]|nr:threonylcarbamoyl-AMP synthase [Chloroflexota bacterium]